MLTTIWEKTIFKKLIKFIFFFLLGIYAVFVITDFSVNSSHFLSYNIVSFLNVFLFYLYKFIKYSHIFVPLGLLFGIIKVISDMNIHNELVNLQMAGLSLKKILRPVFVISIILTIFCLCNFEFFCPKARNSIEHFEDQYITKKSKKNESKLFTTTLLDNSKLIYQEKNSVKKELFDIFWIRSNDEIWHIKSLKTTSLPAKGHFVDVFKRTNNAFLEKVDSYTEYTFSNMPFETSIYKDVFVPFANRSISELIYKHIKKIYASSKDKASISSQFNSKLVKAFFPILIFFAIPPFCIKFKRGISIFFISALSLFSFIFLLTLIDSMIILSENQIFFPSFLIWTPFIIITIFFGINFYKEIWKKS
jgi:lipopolysaccharide export LptBFGC system permease protein LptF